MKKYSYYKKQAQKELGIPDDNLTYLGREQLPHLTDQEWQYQENVRIDYHSRINDLAKECFYSDLRNEYNHLPTSKYQILLDASEQDANTFNNLVKVMAFNHKLYVDMTNA